MQTLFQRYKTSMIGDITLNTIECLAYKQSYVAGFSYV